MSIPVFCKKCDKFIGLDDLGGINFDSGYYNIQKSLTDISSYDSGDVACTHPEPEVVSEYKLNGLIREDTTYYQELNNTSTCSYFVGDFTSKNLSILRKKYKQNIYIPNIGWMFYDDKTKSYYGDGVDLFPKPKPSSLLPRIKTFLNNLF